MAEPKRAKGTLTIYDVAKLAGVSIASVSRVLNGQGTPRAETRDRVMRAVRELSFVPDGAARALSNGLKEVVGVVFRRESGETYLEGEDESFLFIDVINRGIEMGARRRGFDLLISSVGYSDDNVAERIAALAGKADGLILHDRMLSAVGIARMADVVPVVTLAGSPTPASMNVRCDNEAGVRALVRHLVIEHGYRSLGYVSGRADSPDNRTRQRAFETEAAAAGADIDTGPAWQGNYSAAGGANVVESLLAAGRKLPRAILCANDQTALGVIHALAQRGMRVPQDVAITGFDDVPVARHLHPPLTTVRQPMQELGAKAFDILYSRISAAAGAPDTVLPVELIVRESCGCTNTAAKDRA
ncbi:MAG: LacI family transcriptional regulator [Chloroflexi bacterium]|nr:MAG: LacI family transcriptional regulator [Chloroflexota bacterium]TME58443.1 MAG: LacI family transcriptional regulator [Chloroflexota bacterium]